MAKVELVEETQRGVRTLARQLPLGNGAVVELASGRPIKQHGSIADALDGQNRAGQAVGGEVGRGGFRGRLRLFQLGVFSILMMPWMDSLN